MLNKFLELGADEGFRKLELIFGETDPFVTLVPFKTISKRYEICDSPLPTARVSYFMIMDIPSEFLDGVRTALEGAIADCSDKEGPERALVIHYPIPDNMNKHMH